MTTKKANASKAEEVNVPAIIDSKGENLLDIMQSFEQMNDEDLTSLDAAYLNPELNTTYNFAFVGIEKAVISNKEVDVARVADKKGDFYLIGASVIVNALKKIADRAPIAVRIITGGEEKSQTSGNKYISAKVLHA